MRIASSVGTSQRLLMDSLRFKVNQRPVHATRQLARPQDYSGDFGAAGEASRNLIWLRTKYQCCLALICQDTKLGPLLRASARRAKAVTFCFSLTGERTGSHLTVFFVCFVLLCFDWPLRRQLRGEPPACSPIVSPALTGCAQQVDTKARRSTGT